ncbi:glycosyltransferase [Mycetocola zhadangensis]|uniref:Glycosyltransferase n=2 Tax=Mycetocola zhadangensis TaxID=1164595 RepID=A0A3L7J596_9MICO|nr:glycosyltransferase [Mycetocola zhadangensis]
MNVAVRATALELGELGHTVDIVTRRTAPQQASAHKIAANVTVHHLTAGPVERRIKGEHEGFIAEFGTALDAFGDVDIVHSHHWFSGMAAIDVARRRGIPHVQSFHSIAADVSTPLSEGERPESPGRMRGEALLARESDAVIAVSAAERDTIVNRLGAAPTRVSVVHPGVDSALFTPLETPTTEHPGYVVVAARLEPLKGLDLAIAALAAIPAADRPDLVVAGGPTTGHESYPTELRTLASDAGITVRFVGPQSRRDLAVLLRGARMLLVPSHSETFGLVALEAAASGIPVVAMRSGGLVEAVEHGTTGLLIDTRDASSWTDAISRLLADPTFATSLGTAGRARALDFPWRHTALHTLDVYQGLLAGRGRVAS